MSQSDRITSVAIQGTHGSFSEAATRWRWPEAELVTCREVRDVVAAVRDSRAEAGCLAIENSLFGSVTATYDLLHDAFGDGELHLSDEILLPVFHALLALPGASLGELDRAFAEDAVPERLVQVPDDELDLGIRRPAEGRLGGRGARARVGHGPHPSTSVRSAAIRSRFASAA